MLYTVVSGVVAVIGFLFGILVLVIGIAYLKNRSEDKRKRKALLDVIVQLDSPGNQHSLDECINFLERIGVVTNPTKEFINLHFYQIRYHLTDSGIATIIRWLLKWNNALDQKVAVELHLISSRYGKKDWKRINAILAILKEKAPTEFKRFEEAWAKECGVQNQEERYKKKEELVKKALKELNISEPEPDAHDDTPIVIDDCIGYDQ